MIQGHILALLKLILNLNYKIVRNLRDLTFDLETANTELAQEFTKIFGRLAVGVYSDFEKRFHLQLIKFVVKKIKFWRLMN